MLTDILITCIHTDIRVHPRDLVRPRRQGWLCHTSYEPGNRRPIYYYYPSPGQYNPALFPALQYQH